MEAVTSLLARLPGIGSRTAQRLAFHILKEDPAYAQALATALLRLGSEMRMCSQCHNHSAVDPCVLCADEKRDRSVLCVVATPQDLNAVEACGEYRGHYHVLGGLLSPLEGTGPENLRIRELLRRLEDNPVSEVILALRPSVEGEGTSYYLRKMLTPLGVNMTIIASGIPLGGELEYADKGTLARAITGRRPA